jgi:hypothetical protein
MSLTATEMQGGSQAVEWRPGIGTGEQPERTRMTRSQGGKGWARVREGWARVRGAGRPVSVWRAGCGRQWRAGEES